MPSKYKNLHSYLTDIPSSAIMSDPEVKQSGTTVATIHKIIIINIVINKFLTSPIHYCGNETHVSLIGSIER